MNTLLAIVIMNCLALIPHLNPPSNKMEKLLQTTAIGYLSLPQPSRKAPRLSRLFVISSRDIVAMRTIRIIVADPG